MTQQELENSVKTNTHIAKMFYENEKEEKYFPSTIIIEGTKKGEKRSIIVAFGNDQAFNMRADLLFDLGIRSRIELFKKEMDSIEAIFMMSEAWASFEKINKKKTVKENMEDAKFIRPSLDPNRIEVLMSSGLTRDKKKACDVFEIKRYLDLKKEQMNVTFLSLREEAKKEDEETFETPLLERFWEGESSMDTLFNKMPKDIIESVNNMSVDGVFKLIISQINIIRGKQDAKH